MNRSGAFRLHHLSQRFPFAQSAQEARRIPGDNGARGYALGHNRASTDNSSCTDRNSTQDDRPGPNRGAAFDHNGNHLPVGVRLQGSVRQARAREQIVDEADVMANEYVVFDGDAFANE